MNSEFGCIDKKKSIIILAFSLLCGLLFANTNVAEPLFIGLTFITAFIDPVISISFYFTLVLYLDNPIIQVMLLLAVCLGFFFKNPRMFREMRAAFLLIFGTIVIILSYILGYQSTITVAFLMFLCLIMVVLLLNNRKFFTPDCIALFFWGYMAKAFSLCGYFLSKFISGDVVYKYGRLSFDGDIKIISVTVAVPIIILLSTKLNKKRLFQNYDFGLLTYVICGVLVALLLATAARGVTISILISLLCHFITTKKKSTYLLRLLPIAIFVIVFLIYNIDNPILRLERFFNEEEFATGNGRTEIWQEFFTIIWDRGPLAWLFGMGPGNISRVSSIGAYAHSVYLDFFFSYGIFGFTIVLISEIKVFKKVLVSKDITMLSLFVALILMYFTHGSSADIGLFSLQTMIFLKICSNNNENSEKMLSRKENCYGFYK